MTPRPTLDPFRRAQSDLHEAQTAYSGLKAKHESLLRTLAQAKRVIEAARAVAASPYPMSPDETDTTMDTLAATLVAWDAMQREEA